MAVFIMANGKKIKNMEKEFKHLLMAVLFLENGEIIK